MQEMMESLESLEATASRLALTASNLEEMAGGLEQQWHAQQAEMGGRVAQMVAVDGASLSASGTFEARLAEVERALQELREAVELQAAAVAVPVQTLPSQGRRTLPASTTNLLAKHGVGDGGAVEQGAVDAALVSLPVEQRIAIKSQLLRAGLLT